MNTKDFQSKITSVKLAENLVKQFGVKVNVGSYDREQLEDIRNKLRTKIFQQEGSAKFNDLLTNETYQKNKAMLELLNTRIKEMLGEQMKKLRDKMDQLTEAKKSKPDFLDLDKDGNRTEPMKKAAKYTKIKEATRIGTVTPARDQYGDKIPGATPTIELPTSQAERNQLAMQAKANRSGGNLKGVGTQATVPNRVGNDFKIAAVNTNKEYQQGFNSPEINITPGSKYAVADQQARKQAIARDQENSKYNEGIKKDKKGMEGNAFGKAVRDAKKDGVQTGEKIKVGGKEYPVKEAMKKKCCCSTKGEDHCPVHGMTESFPTVDSARADHEKNKTTGKFDKKEVKPGVTQYTRKSNTFTDGGDDSDVKTAKKKAKGVKEGMKHAKDCDCKECMGMYERDEGKHNNKTTGFKALAKKAGGGEKGAKIAGAQRQKMKKAGQLEESQFKHNVRFVNESIGFLLQEDEEAKAKTITAAGDIVNDFTGWMQRIGQYQTKAIIELADSIRADFGAAESEAFKQKVSPALSASLEMLTQQREVLSNAVAELAGEAVPDAPMGMEPDIGMDAGMDAGLDQSAPDEMNPEPVGDEFAASDAAAGGDETAGRGLRENRQQRRARRLAEQHSILSKLAQ
jgi:hypothetical protein